MILIKKGFTVAVLALVVGCSSNNSANNSIQENNSQTATQSPNPVALEETQSNLSEDTTIIPGKRFGKVTPETTRTDLAKIFGESSLEDDTILQAEGTVSVPATKVNSGTEGSFTVFWQDETRKKIAYIKTYGSEWKTPQGIGVGTTLKELRQKLGEFKLTGFGWDYGGLLDLEGTKLSEYQSKLSLRLDTNENAPGNYEQQYREVSGDRQLSSTNPNLEPLDVRVSQITAQFEE